jgi:hypothetical protein
MSMFTLLSFAAHLGVIEKDLRRPHAVLWGWDGTDGCPRRGF